MSSLFDDTVQRQISNSSLSLTLVHNNCIILTLITSEKLRSIIHANYEDSEELNTVHFFLCYILRQFFN